MKYKLPISSNYVKHWGFWEAVRELLQNAYDQADSDPECKVEVDYDDGVLRVVTTTGALTPKTLVLGNSDKSGVRGQFGEGYKLAILVLLRLKLQVGVFTGDQFWTCQMEHDSDFDSEILTIETHPNPYSMNGTQFQVTGVTQEQWNEVSLNLQGRGEKDEILMGINERGRVYSGGLYVCTLQGFRYGYSFTPSTLPLNRDRQMIPSFDVEYQASKLWKEYPDTETVYQLLKEEAPDVKYLDSHETQPQRFFDLYTGYYGMAVPVSTQKEIEQVTKAGIKWVLVPEKLKNILKKVKNFFIPTEGTPVERLRKFVEEHDWRLTDDMKFELKSIIQQLEGNNEPLAKA